MKKVVNFELRMVPCTCIQLKRGLRVARTPTELGLDSSAQRSSYTESHASMGNKQALLPHWESEATQYPHASG